MEYPYSSLRDFLGQARPENKIVGSALATYYEKIPTLEKMVSDAHEYYVTTRQGEALP